jgi:hypothetical protein
MTTEPDGAPIQDHPAPVLHLRVETLSFRADSTETVEALAGAVDDDSGLFASTDFGGRQRRHLVRGVTVVIDTSESLLFGRRAFANIRLGLDFTSQQHALLEVSSRGTTLKDKGSTNGTFVNGAFIHRVRLKHGDVVHFEGGPRSTRLMFRVLLGERPLLDGACRHDGWVILDGATTVPGCQHRAFRRVDADTVEMGTAVATGPGERMATPSQVAPATGFRVTADGAGIPAGRLLQMLRTGQADAALTAALDPVTATDTVDVDGRCFCWTGDRGVGLDMSLAERQVVAAAVAGLLPRLVSQHQAQVAELELLGADDLAAIPSFTAPPGS